MLGVPVAPCMLGMPELSCLPWNATCLSSGADAVWQPRQCLAAPVPLCKLYPALLIAGLSVSGRIT